MPKKTVTKSTVRKYNTEQHTTSLLGIAVVFIVGIIAILIVLSQMQPKNSQVIDSRANENSYLSNGDDVSALERDLMLLKKEQLMVE